MTEIPTGDALQTGSIEPLDVALPSYAIEEEIGWRWRRPQLQGSGTAKAYENDACIRCLPSFICLPSFRVAASDATMAAQPVYSLSLSFI